LPCRQQIAQQRPCEKEQSIPMDSSHSTTTGGSIAAMSMERKLWGIEDLPSVHDEATGVIGADGTNPLRTGPFDVNASEGPADRQTRDD
jgi:hypothetical protein